MIPLLLSLLAAPAVAATLAELGPVPADTVRVFLIRHGQALSNLDPVPDLPRDALDHVTPLGREQARRAGRALVDQNVVMVLSSPASRARESADEIRGILDLGTPSVETRLRPLDLGQSPDGKALTSDARIAEWKAGRDPRPSHGESLEDVGHRVHELVRSLHKDHAGRSVVLVAHSEVIGAFLGRLQGRPGARSYPPGLGNGSISVVELGALGTPNAVLSNHVPAGLAETPR